MNAVQVIIFGFSTLAEANDPQMSPSQRLCFRGCANNLNRNGQKVEQTLIKRLARDVPVPTPPEIEFINDLPEPQVEATLQHARSGIDATRGRLPAARPSQNPQPNSLADRDRQPWSGAMAQTLADMEVPVQKTPAPPSQP